MERKTGGRIAAPDGGGFAHVPFDGWSDATLKAAAADAGRARAGAAWFPRGGVDLARGLSPRGDAGDGGCGWPTDLAAMRFRDRVALAVWLRLEQAADRELVRRGMTLFALPQNMPRRRGLIWGTADAIWTALGDNSRDVNWYTKRATLSAVYSATVLYWLGDDSDGQAGTWDFP
jgi:ubiquinone biosynthesis protein COQ9